MRHIVKSVFVTMLALWSQSVMADRVGIMEPFNGSVTYNIDGENVTLTVIPDDDFYITIDNIIVEKTVDGSTMAQARSDGPGVSEYLTVTAVKTDDRGKGTYTFTLPSGYGAYVRTSFEECIYIHPTISIANGGWTYGDNPVTPTVEGNTADAAVTFNYAIAGEGNYSSTVPTNVGYYSVSATIAAKGHYRSGVTEIIFFEITKAPLVIKAGTYTRKKGEENPEFTLTYEGFKNNDTEAVLTNQPIVTCDATKESAVGDYAVVVSGAEAANYDISYVSGKLTVTEADKPEPGNVNGDNEVDANDVVEVVNYIADLSSGNCDAEIADMNNDNNVNIADIIQIVNMICDEE